MNMTTGKSCGNFRMASASRHLKPYIAILAVIAYFTLLCVLSWHKPYSISADYFPDEVGRLKLPLYFFEHGVLPTGAEESTRMDLWGFSYASYPLMLSTLVGGLLMKLMALFTANMDWIVFGARLVSICSATVFAYFAMRIGLTLAGRPYRWIFGFLAALMPQVMFCGLYFNNDIVALAGAAMILYSWMLGLRDGWNPQNACLLAFGVAVVALSYYNAYSWILLSIVIWFAVWIRRGVFHKGASLDERRRFLQLTMLAIGIVLVLVLPFFIRTAIDNGGDMLGLSTVAEYSNRYGDETFKPDNRPTPQHLGMSLTQMLTTDHYMGPGNSWIESTVKSFIGVFGMMSVFLPTWVYLMFLTIMAVGVCGFIVDVVLLIRSLSYRFERGIMDVLMSVNMLIVLALSLQYSYATDYQAQGRYILPLLLSLAYMVCLGWKRSVSVFDRPAIRHGVTYAVLCAIVIGFIVACRTYCTVG